jgi:hypothetical protein
VRPTTPPFPYVAASAVLYCIHLQILAEEPSTQGEELLVIHPPESSSPCSEDPRAILFTPSPNVTLPSIFRSTNFEGARGSAVVKALCYKPEGRGSQSTDGV